VEYSLQDCGEHADLTIICGPDTHRVHKAIVCSQSAFFRLACRRHIESGREFQEAQSGVIVLPSREIENNGTESEDSTWDADAEDPVSVRFMIHYFYHLDYLEDETAKLRSQKREDDEFDKTYALKTGILIEHARMYAMGDKYGIPGLKELALQKYEEAYRYTSAGFANSIIIAFTSTLDADMDLRNVIITYLDSALDIYMTKPKIDQIVRDFPQLSHALIRKQFNLDT
jgi:hypothetical protein